MKQIQKMAGTCSVLTVALALAACGGGSGGSSETAPVVQGTAAVGSPVVSGDLALTCAKGTRTAKTDDTGRYQIDLSTVTLPCAMVLTGGKVDGKDSDWTMSTAVLDVPSVANLTPWTHLVMARLLAAADPGVAIAGMTPEDLQKKLAPSSVGAATAAVQTEMGRLLGAEPSSDIDPITTPFVATDGNGMDGLLVRLMTGLRWTAKTLPQAAKEIAAGPLQITDVPQTCRPGVLTGFTGKFDDVPVQVVYDPKADAGDGGGAGGAGSGAGGGAGAGAGGSLGQFLNAVVRVERSDGSLLGEAVTDASKGMVTVVPCRYQGPVHITVKAKADGSSKYFEESIGRYANFPAGEEMNAVAPAVNKNLGITLLTEAAWQYLVAKHGVDGWKNVDFINEANKNIRDEFNKFLPKGLQITDITRLPFLVGGSTAAGSIDATPNGIYGVVSSGLARAAGLMRIADLAPALKLVRQLGKDFCDGKLDLACNGVPVMTDSKDAAYLPPQFSESLNRGIGDIAAMCGNNKINAEKFNIIQVSMGTSYLESSGDMSDPIGIINRYRLPIYHDKQPIYMLTSDGFVYSWPNRDSQAVESSDQVFSRIFSQTGFNSAGILTSGEILVDAAEGSGISSVEFSGATTMAGYSAFKVNLFSDYLWMDAQIARLQNGKSKYYPYYINGEIVSREAPLPDIVSVSLSRGCCDQVKKNVASPVFYASTGDGSVYTWGQKISPAVTTVQDTLDPDGNTPKKFWNVFDPPPSKPAEPPDVYRSEPEKVKGLPSIATVVGAPDAALAIDRNGGVWTWDSWRIPDGESYKPTRRVDLDAFGPVQQISCGVTKACAALTRSGKLVVWGKFGNDEEYIPPEMKSVQKVFSAVDVPLPIGRKVIYLGASIDMIYALLDDGRIVVFPSYPTAPKFIDPKPAIPPLLHLAPKGCPQ